MSPDSVQQLGRWTYDVAWDDPPPGAAWRMQRIASWQLVDDVTGKPLQTTITLIVEQANLYPRVAEDGLIGVVGIPRKVFPNLKNQNYVIDVTIQAVGYIDVQKQATLLAASNTTFPVEFKPALHEVLRMQPV